MPQRFFALSEALLAVDAQALAACKGQFAQIEEICDYNQLKMLKAFTDCKVSSSHLVGTTGYGYDDAGREKLDEVFAVADWVTVLRDGRSVGTAPAKELTQDQVIARMVGRELKELRSSLEIIRNTAAEIIDSVEGCLQEMRQEVEPEEDMSGPAMAM